MLGHAKARAYHRPRRYYSEFTDRLSKTRNEELRSQERDRKKKKRVSKASYIKST